LFEADEANHVEDATGYGDVKVAALLEHRSQHHSTMGISSVTAPGGTEPGTTEDPDVARFRQRVGEELARQGSLGGMAAGEAFHRIARL
jgi:hypothetical protein